MWKVQVLVGVIFMMGWVLIKNGWMQRELFVLYGGINFLLVRIICLMVLMNLFFGQGFISICLVELVSCLVFFLGWNKLMCLFLVWQVLSFLKIFWLQWSILVVFERVKVEFLVSVLFCYWLFLNFLLKLYGRLWYLKFRWF